MTDLNYMRDCEAREWTRRFNQKKQDVGAYEARQWWLDTIADIEKKRGKSAADDLRNRMNRIRHGHTDPQGANISR